MLLANLFFLAKYFDAADKLRPASISSVSSCFKCNLFISKSFVLSIPFITIVISSLFDIVLHFLLPFLISLWISSWVYSTIIGDPWKRNLTEPFWFIHWRNSPR